MTPAGFGKCTVRRLILQLNSFREKPCLGLAVSPDGKSILYAHNEPGAEESTIILVKNFR